MQILFQAIAGFLSGICASLGLGGGFVLLIYLTAIMSMNQFEGQLMNLLFFLPIGGLSIFLHIKNHLIETKITLPTAISGCVGAVGGVMLASLFEPSVVSKCFAVFILIIGATQLLGRDKKEDSKSPS